MTSKPIIAITMGDAGGIGPEVAVGAAARPGVRRICRPLLVGDLKLCDSCLPGAGRIRLVPVNGAEGMPRGRSVIPVAEPCRPILRHRWGIVRKDYGEAAMGYIRFAVEEALAGRVRAVVTAPICKEAIHRAGYGFQGHTDYLAHLTRARRHAMMLMGRGLRVVLVTVHEPIADVSRNLSRDKVRNAIALANGACRRLGVVRPRIAVCALNPHAGESGAFGREEIETIRPAIRSSRRTGIAVEGPFPADTLFVERNRESFDAVVAMYHDQGLIPLKMLAFDVGVNVTLGLPIVRTSPDHGTAFGIAGKGVADLRSMEEAIKAACRLCLSTDG